MITQPNTLPLIERGRRNRKSSAIRSLVRETRVHPTDLIAPLFILEGVNTLQEISSMPGIFRRSIDETLREIESLVSQGVKSVLLFPVIKNELKDALGSYALSDNNLYIRAVEAIKSSFPEVCVMVDLALDPFTDHGHDGVVDENRRILNDPTVEILGHMATLAADAGVDIVAPSDMMDGRVAYIRNSLDGAGYQDVGILSYAAKYASSFYGPFRDALHSSPRFGDKKTYQMDPANVKEALLEAMMDEREGADMLLVKPGLPYLDVLAKVKEQSNIPVGAYHVSGEYSMVIAAAERGWVNQDKVFYESLLSIKRAGADFILSYTAHRIKTILEQQED